MSCMETLSQFIYSDLTKSPTLQLISLSKRGIVPQLLQQHASYFDLSSFPDKKKYVIWHGSGLLQSYLNLQFPSKRFRCRARFEFSWIERGPVLLEEHHVFISICQLKMMQEPVFSHASSSSRRKTLVKLRIHFLWISCSLLSTNMQGVRT